MAVEQPSKSGLIQDKFPKKLMKKLSLDWSPKFDAVADSLTKSYPPALDKPAANPYKDLKWK